MTEAAQLEEPLFDAPRLWAPVLFKDRVTFKDYVHVVFLDIDGVINNVKTVPNGVKPLRSGIAPELVVGIDRRQTQMLNQLVGFPEEDHLLVVLSTSWRNSHGIEQTEDTLERADFAGIIAGATPNLGNRRASEIQAWLDDWAADPELPPVRSFVILDDCEPYSMEHLQDRLVQTHPMNGICWDDVFKAQRLLFPEMSS